MKPERIIEKNRKKIDKITKKIIELIQERSKAAKEIGTAKKKLGLPTVDMSRERKVIENAKRAARKIGVDTKIVEKIMRILILHAKKVQNKKIN